MKHLFIIAISILTAFTVNGQVGLYSMSQDRATAVDTARYKVTYSLNYTCHPGVENRFDDVRTLLIGRRYVKDFSDIICH